MKSEPVHLEYYLRDLRDLFDLHKALDSNQNLAIDNLIKCYLDCMKFFVEQSRSQQYFHNMEAKMKDTEFFEDITALIRPTESYNQK